MVLFAHYVLLNVWILKAKFDLIINTLILLDCSSWIRIALDSALDYSWSAYVIYPIFVSAPSPMCGECHWSHFSNITVLSQTQACSCTRTLPHTQTHTHSMTRSDSAQQLKSVCIRSSSIILKKSTDMINQRIPPKDPHFLWHRRVSARSLFFSFFFYLLCYLSKSLCDSPFHRILPKTLAAARFVSEPRLSSSQQRAAILSPIQAPPRLRHPPPRIPQRKGNYLLEKKSL